MLDKEASIDYNAVEKQTSTVIWTKVGLELCADMLRETDNRNPAVFNLKTADPEFTALGELEVMENSLRLCVKAFKNANKKKSPQSAWKPVYAALEAMTIYMQTKNSWVTGLKNPTRAVNAFIAFGCGWVSTAEKLSELGSFGENFYPSVRCAVNAAIAIGNEMNERAGKKLSDWPTKLECVWTGSDYAGEKKKKPVGPTGDDDDGAKKKSKKKKAEFEDEDDVQEGKKKKGGKKSGSPVVSADAPLSWDFEDAITRLKQDRKQIGGTAFDIAVMTDELRDKLAVAAV